MPVLVALSVWGGVRDVAAQVFQAQGGTSSLYRASGGSLLMRTRDQEVRVSAGVLHDQFRIGSLARKRLGRYTISLGDDAVDLRLPTDVSAGTRYVPTRGASVALDRNGTKIFALGGTSSETAGASFFQAAEWGDPVAILFVDRPVSDTVALFSRNVIGERRTSVHGVVWHAHPTLEVRGGAGLGAGARYLSTSATLERGWISARGGYVDAGPSFRTIAFDREATADAVRENLTVTLRPTPAMTFQVSRQNLVQPGGPNRPSMPEPHLAVNHAGATFNVGGFRLGGSLYETRGGPTNNVGMSVTAGRALTEHLEASGSYYRSRTGAGDASDSLVAMLRQIVNPRVSVAAFATRTDGQTTVRGGGEFLSNLVTVGVDYQTVYTPFRSDGPFTHGVAVNFGIQPAGSLRLQLGTMITPTGQMRYTISGSQTFRRATGSAPERSFRRFPKYLVRGRVQDEAGRAVAGAVLRFGSDVVVTDDAGQFFLRTRDTKMRALVVATAEFTAPGRYRVVSAPLRVKPAKDGEAQAIVIVVSRVFGDPAAGSA